MKILPRKSDASRLFSLSFLILFFELVCIRWLSSYVLYLGYFTNFVLLGALLGIGAGALMSRKSTRLLAKTPLLMFIFFTLILFTRAQISPNQENVIYFTSSQSFLRLPAEVLLPIIFIGVTTIFTFLSQDVGTLLTRFPPLKAYNLNILGSLAGIAGFTILSYTSVSSWVWFLVAMVVLIFLLPHERFFGVNVILSIGLVVVVASSDYAFANIWSPYYRLNLYTEGGTGSNLEPRRVMPGDVPVNRGRYVLTANGVGHQAMNTMEGSEQFYQLPYSVFSEKPDYQEVLVIGAGGGNDVAFALANGAGHVDAVEIDSQIIRLGERFHPEHPYSDPRVTVYVNDARSYLQSTNKKYDLIVYALPDSLVLATNSSNLRLESYLFTIESFQQAKKHLTSNGLLVLYNYYRYDWLIQKIGGMLRSVFGAQPHYHRLSSPEYEIDAFATIFAGPKSAEIDANQSGFFMLSASQTAPATDDWPFLYLSKPSLPGFYTITLVVILIASLVLIRIISPKISFERTTLPFFFMGAAFTLLETKSLVQFLLLFGSTWIVNSLVFFSILLAVLIANVLAARYRFSRLWLLYALLFLSLAVNLMIPIKSLLFENETLKYLAATILLFSPIFFANLIYSTTFRDTDQADVSFGANLLGTMLGGTVEYLSLYFGYQNLVFLAGFFYLLAFGFFYAVQNQKKAVVFTKN